jgi:two-component system chemotaxis sensor kinase CheA
MEDLIIEFLTETNESLGELDTALVQLEQDPNNKDLLSKIFRVMHTIKGTSGFLNLPRLGSVAHKGEDLLGLFRDGKLQANSAYISLILEAIDRIKMIIANLETAGKEPEGEDSDLIHKLEAACNEETAPAPAADASVIEPSAEEDIFSPVPVEEQFTAPVETAPPVPAEPTPPSAPTPTAPAESSVAAQTLRVNVDVLEDLMTLVSELVLTRNQILQIARTQKDNEMSSSFQRLNHIVSDLQDGVMKTRMQPVGNAWQKLPRIIRDISNDLGKKIELEMLGQDTELDRQVLEMIKDPLTHMVRNSADHGVEKPADRLAAGKPETGRIRLNSYHEGGHIIIEITDDGRGLPLEKIKKKILQNKLVTEAELANMSAQQIQQYIFAAGFSTAEQVTAVSGRGVGMDVVRTNIEKIGGSIEMNSVEGKGTTFLIKIPLTLAIVSSLIVGIANERFAIPQLDVSELVMVTPGGQNKIETIDGTPFFRLRERLLPLIGLRELLGFPEREDVGARFIAIVHVGSYSFGMIVDRVFDTEEIVVKPVSSLLAKQSVFSGNTILGDGQVIMILDSAGILKTAGISAKATNTRPKSADADLQDNKAVKPLLLFLAGDQNLKAVPLQHVARLEEIELSKIEHAGGKRVIQYGDKLMPLHLHDPAMNLPKSGKRPVIVFGTKDGNSGLIVDRILDITAHKGEFQVQSKGALEGSAIVQGKTTDIINLEYEQLQNPIGANGSHMPAYHAEQQQGVTQ